MQHSDPVYQVPPGTINQPDTPPSSEIEITLDQYFDILNKGLDSRLITHYRKNRFCFLSSLCDKYGSDKGSLNPTGHVYNWPPHSYADYYSRLFDHCRPHIKRVFECGIGTNNPQFESSMGITGKPGASLRVWREYFPNAIVIGADIDRDILFDDDRIRTFHVDQTDSESVASLWTEVEESNFDFMVDDGLHTLEAGVCMFENSIGRLGPGGIYAIEDVNPKELLAFKDYFSGKDYRVEFVNLLRPGLKLKDNSLVVIRHITQEP